MKRRIAPLVLTCAAMIIGSLMSGGVSPASAHERRAIGDKYMMVVGFLKEPAFVREQNGLDLRIFTGPAGANLQELPTAERIGVEGLEDTLKAEVILGTEKMALTIEPRFRDPGAYNGHFFPTVTGDYTFHIFGTVEGTTIDESFTSSPDGFGAVDEVATLQFPKKVPSSEELAARIDALKLPESASDSAGGEDDGSDTATVLAIVGIALGALGLGAGALALARGRS